MGPLFEGIQPRSWMISLILAFSTLSAQFFLASPGHIGYIGARTQGATLPTERPQLTTKYY